MTVSDWTMQFLADMIGSGVDRIASKPPHSGLVISPGWQTAVAQALHQT